MAIKTMMHKSAEWVDADASVADVAKRMRDKDIGAIPVKADGQLIGMITDRNITLHVVAAANDAGRLGARDVMSADIVTCREHDEATDAVHVMETKKLRRLPVLDDNKQLVGMLSLGDISLALTRNTCCDVLKAISAHHA